MVMIDDRFQHVENFSCTRCVGNNNRGGLPRFRTFWKYHETCVGIICVVYDVLVVAICFCVLDYFHGRFAVAFCDYGLDL